MIGSFLATAKGTQVTVIPSKAFNGQRRRELAEDQQKRRLRKLLLQPTLQGKPKKKEVEKTRDRPSVPPGTAEFEVVDYHAFSAFDFGSISWLVDSLIPSVGCGFLAAVPKIGKTWLALDLAIAVAAGEEYLGRQTQIGNALYIGGEGGHQHLQRRLAMLVRGRSLQHSAFAERLLIGMNPRIRLDRPNGVQALRSEIERTKPSLLILDPLTRFHEARENERDSIEPVLSRLRQISEDYGLFILVIHHAPKPRKDIPYDPLRGTSAMRAWHDSLIWLERKGDAVLLHAELRDAEEPPMIGVHLGVEEGQAKLDLYVPEIDDKADEELMIQIEEMLQDGPLPVHEIAKLAKKRKAKVAQLVSQMAQLGVVKKAKAPVQGSDLKTYFREVVELSSGIQNSRN